MNISIFVFLREILIGFSLVYYYTKSSPIQMPKIKTCAFTIITVGINLLLLRINAVLLDIIISYLVVAIGLKILNRENSFIKLAFSYTVTYFLLLANILPLGVMVGVRYSMTGYAELSEVIAISSFVITFSVGPLLNELGKLNISKIDDYFRLELVKKLVGVVTFLLIAFLVFLSLSMQFGFSNYANFSWMMIFISSAFLIAIIVIVVAIIVHIKKENLLRDEEEKKRVILEESNKLLFTENVKLADENQSLKLENEETQRHLNDLTETYTELLQDFGNVRASHHSYRYIVPMLINLQRKMLEEFDTFANQPHHEKMSWLTEYKSHIKTLLIEVDENIAADKIRQEVEELEIPAKMIGLEMLLQTVVEKTKEENIYLSMYNYFNDWEKLDVPSVSINNILSNLIDNAIKETCKAEPEERREIQITFKADILGNFCFEVQDGAMEFHVDMLKNLGKRGNSINGTGDGYSEIFEELDALQGSFLIKEMRVDERYRKKIIIGFDGRNNKGIESGHRYEELEESLEGSLLDVY